MKIHIIQHLAHEHAASIVDWAKESGNVLSYTHVFAQPFSFPALDDFDMLIILGGTMGAYEEKKFPWLIDEKNFIKHAIETNKLVLGICLGSQILAEILGSSVFPHTKKEIGFFPVYKTAEANHEHVLGDIPDEWIVFHWHGDTFDLPPGAVHLFFSHGCRNQGFRKDKCFGFQFHGEVNDELLYAMIDHERNELVKDDYVQSETDILAYSITSENIKYFKSFLDKITTTP